MRAAPKAKQAKKAVQTNVDALKPMLQGLNYADETSLLQQFVAHFAEYRVLDQRILDLAVENTNLKAQRLSFGPAQEAADSYRVISAHADSAVIPARSERTDCWRTHEDRDGPDHGQMFLGDSTISRGHRRSNGLLRRDVVVL